MADSERGWEEKNTCLSLKSGAVCSGLKFSMMRPLRPPPLSNLCLYCAQQSIKGLSTYATKIQMSSLNASVMRAHSSPAGYLGAIQKDSENNEHTPHSTSSIFLWFSNTVQTCGEDIFTKVRYSAGNRSRSMWDTAPEVRALFRFDRPVSEGCQLCVIVATAAVM